MSEEIVTNAKMNDKIIGILKLSDDSVLKYAAKRIEELEEIILRSHYDVPKSEEVSRG